VCIGVVFVVVRDTVCYLDVRTCIISYVGADFRPVATRPLPMLIPLHAVSPKVSQHCLKSLMDLERVAEISGLPFHTCVLVQRPGALDFVPLQLSFHGDGKVSKELFGQFITTLDQKVHRDLAPQIYHKATTETARACSPVYEHDGIGSWTGILVLVFSHGNLEQTFDGGVFCCPVLQLLTKHVKIAEHVEFVADGSNGLWTFKSVRENKTGVH